MVKQFSYKMFEEHVLKGKYSNTQKKRPNAQMVRFNSLKEYRKINKLQNDTNVYPGTQTHRHTHSLMGLIILKHGQELTMNMNIEH